MKLVTGNQPCGRELLLRFDAGAMRGIYAKLVNTPFDIRGVGQSRQTMSYLWGGVSAY